VERLGEGVDKVEDVVLEVSRCVREVLSGGGGTIMLKGGGGEGAGGVSTGVDRGYETADEDNMTVRGDEEGGGGGRDGEYGYADSIYTIREEEDDDDDDDWETRTAITELEPGTRREDQWDTKKQAEATWHKGDWKGLEVFG
ncbi:hypothetical protein I5L01_15525, partial [Erythrobacter sp. YJ-T3-07]|uniref:hypothetical protein n=1 Tax=Erythrobacter sp. YJ-T3-07 TaxID=2793063 RepID=UPI0018D40261